MSFPLSPANNQVTLENGISYTYNSSRGAWYRTPATALNSITANTITALNSLIVGGNTSVTGSILPSATLTYDLGSEDLRWRDLYLSGNTLNLGTASITTDANTGAIALVPAVTASNPNPVGLVITATGSITSIQSVGGVVYASNIQSIVANTGSVVFDSSLMYYAANTANLAIAVNATQNTSITNFTQLFTGVEVTQNARLTFTESYTQAAFDKANTGTILAQAAFDAANNASGGGEVIDAYARTTANTNSIELNKVDVYAYGAYGKANSANVLAQAAFDAGNTSTTLQSGINTTQNTNIIAADTYASGAYNKANTGTILAQAAFNAANNASGGGEVIDAYARTTANSKFNSTGGTISGSVVVSNDLTVNGNVSFIGNVTSIQVTGNSGQYFGYAANGFQALYTGIPTGYRFEPQIVQQITGNYDGYSGVNLQNINNGQYASSDYFITADNGTVTEGFLDLGLASSTYNYTGYSLIKPNDGYLIVSGNTASNRGNLILGTILTDDVVFSVNGINTENEVMRINSSNNVVIKSTNASTNKTSGALQVVGGVGVQGDLYANNVTGNVLALTTTTASNTAVGYLGVPQRIVSMGGSDSLVLADAGKQLYLIPDSNVYSIFIPSNASVPFPVGTAIVTVLTGPYSANVAPLAGVTLRMAGNTSGANIARTLGSYSMASLLKVENDVWFISGSGVT